MRTNSAFNMPSFSTSHPSLLTCSMEDYNKFLDCLEEMLRHMGMHDAIKERGDASLIDGTRRLDYTSSAILEIIQAWDLRRLSITTSLIAHDKTVMSAYFIPAVGAPILLRQGIGYDLVTAFWDLLVGRCGSNLLFHVTWDAEHSNAWLSSNPIPAVH